MAGSKGIAGAFSRHYDKVIAIVVLIGLLVSLVYLSLTAGTRQAQQDQFETKMENLPVKYPTLAPIDPGPYEAALDTIRNPFVFPVPTNSLIGLITPPERAWCPTCQMPNELTATLCSTCNAKQPDIDDKGADRDGGGIPDSVEIEWGLQPFDPRDDAGDLDADGYSNLEEYTAKSDPKDPASHPPLEDRVVVKEMTFEQLELLFKAKIKLADGTYRLQTKDVTNNRDYFVKVGDQIGKTQYKVTDFRALHEMQHKQGFKEPQKVDTSVVVLEGRGETIELVLKEKTQYKNFTVELELILDGSTYRAGQGDTIEIRGRKFEVTIDRKTEAVSIRNLSSGRKITVPTQL